MPKPCPLTAGLADYLHDYRPLRFYRVAGKDKSVIWTRRPPSGCYEPLLTRNLDEIAAEIRVAPDLLLEALELMRLPIIHR